MQDLINRQDAINALIEWVTKLFDDRSVVDVINEVPSTQPEIIHCTECKHYREYDSKYVENAVVVQCMADRYPISETIPDGWFCAGAERKNNE